jgi:hypothetical protein
MSAPAGWHLQPDGRERYWDGTAWTEQFRMPAPTEPMDPTAPPPPPSWSATVDETQALDVSGTQVLPQAGPPPQAPQTSQTAPPATYPAQQDSGYAGYPVASGGLPPAGAPGGYGPPGAPGGYGAAGGYGTPGGQWQAPPPSGSGGLAKGCLIAALGVLLLVGIVVVAVIVLFARAADDVVSNLPTTFPTELPSGVPSDLPTEGLGDRIDIAVGDGFDLPRAAIEDGWRLEAQGGGVPIVNVTGMRATLEDDNGFPVLFTMSFPADGGDAVETVCTAPAGSAGATVDVTCVPLFGDVAEAGRATVTASL